MRPNEISPYSHYSGAKWAPRRLQSPLTSLFVQPFIEIYIKENIKIPRHLPFVRETTGDRWILLTKGQ